MSVIPEVKCRRCGQSFSALKTTCPNCGTRKVTQSVRTPGTTPGTVRGTASYERAETNTKWQMIFGLILVVAVILAVIVMVTTSLNGSDLVSSKITPPPTIEPLPVVEAAPTPPPTPTPTVEKINIKYAENTLDTGEHAPTLHLGDAPLVVKAEVIPQTIEGAVVTWTSSAPDVLSATPTEDGGCELTILGTVGGGVLVTAECFGVKGECRIYCVE